MAGSVNKVVLVGNLGRDPEVRNTQSGMKIINLAVATSDSWNDKSTGERKELTEWHRIVIMNERLADVAEKYLCKGSKIYIEGKLQTRKWTDQSGTEKFSTEILLGKFGGELVLLDKRQDGDAYEAPKPKAAEERKPLSGGYSAPSYDDDSDAIPF